MEDLSASLNDKLAHSSFRLKTAERERHVFNSLLVATPCEALQYCPRLGRIMICHLINRFDSAFGFNPSRLLSCGAAFSGVTALIMIVWGHLDTYSFLGRTHVFNNILAATPCEALQYPLRLRRITIYQSINRFDSAFGFNPWSLPSCRAAFSGVTALMMIAWGR